MIDYVAYVCIYLFIYLLACYFISKNVLNI